MTLQTARHHVALSGGETMLTLPSTEPNGRIVAMALDGDR